MSADSGDIIRAHEQLKSNSRTSSPSFLNGFSEPISLDEPTHDDLDMNIGMLEYINVLGDKVLESDIGEENRNSRAEEAKAKEEKARHEEAIKRSEKMWKEIADRKEWDSVIANLEVYKFSGQAVVKEVPVVMIRTVTK